MVRNEIDESTSLCFTYTLVAIFVPLLMVTTYKGGNELSGSVSIVNWMEGLKQLKWKGKSSAWCCTP
jgi:hypothetical protein